MPRVLHPEGPALPHWWPTRTITLALTQPRLRHSTSHSRSRPLRLKSCSARICEYRGTRRRYKGAFSYGPRMDAALTHLISVSTPNFLGIIPGGQSFVVPEGTITTDSTTGTGFSYQANLRAGTTFLLMGGDVQGNGTGGSVTYIVGLGNDDGSCLSNNSPSSTPGTPAGETGSSSSPSSTGGSVPTGT